MNEHSLHVKVVTPNGVVFDYETATLVVLSTTGGEVGVMANHAPIISALKVSEVKIVDEANGVEERLAVSGQSQHRTDEQADQNANDQADAVVAGNCLIQRFHIDTPLSYCTPMAYSFLSLTQGRVLL